MMMNDLPPGKIFSEDMSRQRIMAIARELGCDQDLLQVFNRYDRLLRNCDNASERKSISLLGVAEVNKILGYTGSCTVGGVQIGDPSQDPQPESD
jgi:hypothetical protein